MRGPAPVGSRDSLRRTVSANGDPVAHGAARADPRTGRTTPAGGHVTVDRRSPCVAGAEQVSGTDGVQGRM